MVAGIKNGDLKKIIKGIQSNDVLIPKLHTILNDPNFTGFDIEIEPWTARPPDGYFHPSTQATWNARQLALYLMAPQLFEQERMQLTSVFAITQGHFWHMFIQHVLKEEGILVEDELGFTDEEHKRRGHMDGLLAVKGMPEGLEIKTMNQYTIKKVISAETLREFKFGYWSQAQEYLDVFDLPRMRFLIINPTYPFPMVEFTVPADRKHQAERRFTYKTAIDMAENMKFPISVSDGPACCGDPDNCDAQYACRYQGA